MREHVRPAAADDVPKMVEISERERVVRERLDPEFFRKAQRSVEAQTLYFKWQITQPNVFALVHETGNSIDGFAIASLITAPPVYDPGGNTALVDDFTLADPGLWDSVGAWLFEALKTEARKRGAVGFVSICVHNDEAKRSFLRRAGLRIVSEWHFVPITAR